MGVLTVYLLQGDNVLESSQILVLPPDAASEVLAIFSQMTAEVEQFFRTFSTSGWLGQLQRSLSWLFGVHTMGAAGSNGTSALAQAASVSNQQATTHPDAAVFYAFEHYYVPFVQQWANVFHHRTVSAAGTTEPDDDARRILNYLMENEMWSCVVLLLGKVPQLTEQAISLGLEIPAEHCLVQSLDMLPAVCGQHRLNTSDQHQRRWRQRRYSDVSLSSDDESFSLESATFILEQLEKKQRVQSAVADPCTRASAAAAEAVGFQQQEVTVVPMFSPFPRAMPDVQHEKQQSQRDDDVIDQRCPVGGDDYAAADAAIAARHVVSTAMPDERDGTPGIQHVPHSCEPDMHESASYSPYTPSHSTTCQQQKQGSKWQTMLTACDPLLLTAVFTGFPEPLLESSYAVYKTHSNYPVDVIVFMICLGMLAASLFRNVRLDDTWPKLASLVAYGTLFLTPYAVMLCWRPLYLRQRDSFLAFGRIASALWLMLIGMGFIALPDGWVAAMTTTASMHMQNALILPACQQVSLVRALQVALVHLPSDAFLLSLGLSWADAVKQSAVIQLSALVTTIAVDLWSRRKFMVRYHGLSCGLKAYKLKAKLI